MNKRFFMALPVIGLTLCGEAYPSDLVFYSKLDSVADITAPQVGAAGVDNGATFQTGKIGNALYVPTHGAVARFPFANGLPTDAFCIEFYAKIMNQSDSFGAACDPFLFGFRKYGTTTLALEAHFNANNGAGKSGLICGCSCSCCVATWSTCDASIPYASILGTSDPKGWHKYTIRWNKAGLDKGDARLAIYIDGVEHAKGITQQAEINQTVSALGGNLELVLSNYSESSTLGVSPLAIDDFKIWKTDTPKEEEDPVLPVVSEVTAKQHYPWCGKIDIGYTVAGSTDGLLVKITVKDNDNDVTYEAKSFDAAPTATPGSHAVVWDATKDGVNKVSKNMVATVSLIVPED